MATAEREYARPAPRAASPGWLLTWMTTVDHKQIGIMYLCTGLAFFLLGGLQALLIRAQLAVPGARVLPPDTYNQFVTVHGVTMIFFVTMPLLFGFANYVVPLMIGARDMAFPRLNALSYWLLLFAGLMLYFSFFAGSAPDVGWYGYAPLTEYPFTGGARTEYWLLSLTVSAIGTIATSVNVVATVLTMRAPGMTLGRVPMFAWMTVIASLLFLWAAPAFTAAAAMLLVDRHLFGHFYDAAAGGDPIIYQHLFWAFGHPEVYVLALPAFGIISEVIPVFSRKPLFGAAFVAAASVGIAALSFMVWAHHMFTVGLGPLANTFFSVMSMLIAVPTGIKIFNWLATMWGGALRFTTAMLFAVGFLGTFVIGGITGVHVALVPLDWQISDSYYLVAHFHYTMMGGVMFGVFAGAYYWFPKITGRLLDERLGQVHFWLMLVGFHLTFFSQHVLGVLGMPRRIYTYPGYEGWAAWNLASTVGAALMGLGTLVFLWNLLASLRHGGIAGPDPWDGFTLEWATASPPPPENFAAPLPLVRGRRPLWDAKHPEHADAGHEGQHAGARRPDSGGIAASGPRASVSDTPAGARPAPPNRQPPTADPAPRNTASVAPRRHWWQADPNIVGVAIFITSEAVFFVALVLVYAFYHGRVVSGPTADEVLDVPYAAVITVLLLASSYTITRAGSRLARDDRRGALLWLVATILLGAAFLIGQGIEYSRLVAEDVTPARNLFGTTFFTLTGFHGLHVLIGLVALFVALCIGFAGRLTARRHGGFEAVALYWHFVDGVWIVVFSVVYLWTLL
jgi:cytochrome c oxidase subunit 1/cytochrome c oxidase subunit I+III